MAMDNNAAVKYLESLLNHTFRAHTSDGRMFLGEFKCTDNVHAFQLVYV
jgi:N-alpha-acetyltransferase 38, NatC auxiliary subunit